ncbi:inorganic phosphate transporter [Natranaeroarchaeum sulfidigenes]|uniref:Phosphate transporter n=1 Tax=Natranaeroarchaeum sulfidigenes TaxID=2784880 RepID=A0A897MTX9_9EURY|nr:inorganic phosphate transporter [Natranaeroarchaeum sulfidigenes]QSG03974.1 Phosphate/sulfate permease [Natranaeroarchaeum sulfidigenes]
MVDLTTGLLFVVAAAASLFAAWTIGAGSTGATPFAPAVGANAITTMRATFIVGILGFAGAVLQGAAVTETVGEGLIRGVTLSPLAAAVALTIAAIYIAAGVFKGYPIATAFAITGSVVGVGLAMGGEPAWQEYGEIGLYWLLTPVVGVPAAYATTKFLRSDVKETIATALLVVIVGVVIANMEFLLLGPPDEQMSIAAVLGAQIPGPQIGGVLGITAVIAGGLSALSVRAVRYDPIRAQRWLLLSLGALVAFTAGGGKVGLAVGPLVPLLGEVLGDVAITPVLIFGGIGILFGSWMVSSRMIKALSQDYADLGPRRSVAILVPSFVIAQIGIFYGIPMSFNQIFISAIGGMGLAAGGAGVSREKFLYTALAWIGSLIFSLVIGYGVYAGVREVTGLE